ncbi:uncharacterized protein LOC128332868 isoform X2 [Hemicordylus capensis]|uniref:uncharacterized protein LOC128332868 isoform X2 n=1 Tax=Hemicordylus capensis TaxID=884348 RepID=UPI002302FD55|nr:uncharacterized protein LOC128332868 isoform X2 [Hemicordylus capensis]
MVGGRKRRVDPGVRLRELSTMGRQAEHPRDVRGRPGWWKSSCVFLAASILSSSFQLNQALESNIMSIKLEPAIPTNGQHVSLIPQPVFDIHHCEWYRKIDGWHGIAGCYRKKWRGHVFGHESCRQNCALHIRNLTFQDSGFYLVKFSVYEISQTLEGQVYLYISGSAPDPLSKLPLALIIASLSLIAVAGSLLFYFLYARRRRPGCVEPARMTLEDLPAQPA